jgi:hypothetical protein
MTAWFIQQDSKTGVHHPENKQYAQQYLHQLQMYTPHTVHTTEKCYFRQQYQQGRVIGPRLEHNLLMHFFKNLNAIL